jgi:Xaa-Pro aminopeptidase
MALSRRQFMKTVAATGAASSLTACAQPERDLSAAKKEFSVGPPIETRQYPPLEDGAFRPPRSWHEKKANKLRDYLRDEKIAGVLLDNVSNQTYFSGLYMSRTERPAMLWLPVEGPMHLFSPALDRDLVDTWGIDQTTYFDFKQSNPATAEEMAVIPHVYGDMTTTIYRHGPTLDLFEWMLAKVKKLGVDGDTVAIDRIGFDPREDANPRQRIFEKVFPGKKLVAVGGTIAKWKLIKDDYEIAMVQKAVDIATEIAIHCRAFMIEYGSDITDFAVRQEGARFGTELVMHTMGLAKQLEDGMPHKGVGFRAGISCRSGMNTAWPHPNQYEYRRLGRGMAVQIRPSCSLAGYSGEGYRGMHIEPMDDFAKKLWEVHHEMTFFQGEETKVGAIAGEVGEKTVEIAVKAGLERYVYHRPAHGWHHTAPWISPGDTAVIQENMMFSNEPGLYAPEHKIGYNNSNCILAKPEKGVQMNKTPLEKEFCIISI